MGVIEPGERSVEAISTAAGTRCWGTFLRIVGWALAIYLVLLAVLMFFEEHMIFYPTRYPQGDWGPHGLEFEDAWFQADDGCSLHGWYVPHDSPKAVVLLAHGNAGNLSNRAAMLRELHGLGVSVLIFDYRGYGRSQGTPSEQGILADARAARQWLAGRSGVSEQQIVLLGRSLGGAVAVDLAAKDGARGLVLESTFSSLPDVAAYHYPMFPVRLIMRTRLDSLAKIGNYQGPLLQSHGTQDRIVPYRFGRRLFEAANEPKQLVTLEGGGHNDFPPPQYYQRLGEFFEALP